MSAPAMLPPYVLPEYLADKNCLLHVRITWAARNEILRAYVSFRLVRQDLRGETLLHARDCAAFPKGTRNGHQLINRSTAMAVYFEVGSRNPLDLTTCSDIDMMSSNAGGRFVHKNGTPYSSS
jgi:hypothetical protein